ANTDSSKPAPTRSDGRRRRPSNASDAGTAKTTVNAMLPATSALRSTGSALTVRRMPTPAARANERTIATTAIRGAVGCNASPDREPPPSSIVDPHRRTRFDVATEEAVESSQQYSVGLLTEGGTGYGQVAARALGPRDQARGC